MQEWGGALLVFEMEGDRQGARACRSGEGDILEGMSDCTYVRGVH